MELLAPAGNREALTAAVESGADAVYLGYTAFGARSFAGNFDEQTLPEAIDYCHARSVRVYVTVNTLARQQELPQVEGLLEQLCRWHADAAIIQDLGVLRLAHSAFPDLALHASTQMTIASAPAVALLKDLGVSRIVPARECRLAELARMGAAGIEVEAFVHGALCVSVSGQCLMSSLIGGRSGNRGKCAQPCRLPYQLGEREGYWLSTRDLCLLGDLPKLQAAGVTSLKIEGRMKRPEYVAVVTALYRQALDALAQGKVFEPTQADLLALEQVFHRGHFTRGHAFDQANLSLIEPSRPSHGGVAMGTVIGLKGHLAQVRLALNLNDGDGLQFRGAQDLDVTYSGPLVPAGQVALVRVSPGVQPGNEVARLTDALQAKAVNARLQTQTRRAMVDMVLKAQPGEAPVLTLTEGAHTVSVEGDQPVQTAQNHPLTPDSAQAQMAKTGDLPYALGTFTLEGQGAHVPLSVLNALRRDGLAKLTQARTDRPHRPRLEAPPLYLPGPGKPLVIAQGAALSQAQPLFEAGADCFYWQPNDLRPQALAEELSHCPPLPAWLVLPPVLDTPTLEGLAPWLKANAAHFAGLVAGNLSHFRLDTGLALVGDWPMNVFNAQCASLLFSLGAGRVTLSPELNAAQLKELTALGGHFEVLAYGRQQLMWLNHCPRRTAAGDRGHGVCERCQREPLPPLVDRKGVSFPLTPLKTPEGCQIRLYNALPTYLGKHWPKLAGLPLSLRAVFTDEDWATQQLVIGNLRAMLAGKQTAELPFPVTAGHFGRGVL